MSDNVRGLVCLVKGTELIEHCKVRAAHHAKQCEESREKYKVLQAKRAELVAAADDAPTEEEAAYATSNKFGNSVIDEQRTVEATVKRHANAAGYFKFMAEHFDARSTYELTPHELHEVEMVRPKHQW